MTEVKTKKNIPKKAEEMDSVLEAVKKCELEIKRDEEAEALLKLTNEFPGSTQCELFALLKMEEFEFARAFNWLDFKGVIFEDEGGYVYPEFRVVE